MEIQAVIDACMAMRDAVAAGDSAAISLSAAKLRSARVANFNALRCRDGAEASVNGHLVFDEAFADSLANGNTTVYDQADDIIMYRSNRGQMTNGAYFTRTCFVRAGKSTKWTFNSKGHQEIAVVAEAGGLVTMKISVSNSAGLRRRYDDTKSVRTGLPQRKTSFELPTDRKNRVDLEIVNCGKKDCSFVIISN